MSIAVIGLNPSVVDSPLPAFTVGARGAVDGLAGSGVGVKEYFYVKFAASTAFTVGQVVQIDGDGVAVPATTTTSAPGSSSGSRVGVVVAAVSSSATAQYGWVQIYGEGLVLVNNGAVLQTALNTTGTAGQLDDDASAGAEIIDGIRLTATAVASEPTAAQINYPFVGATIPSP